MKAGTYSLFTIPNEKEWTIIISTDLDYWGAYSYDKTKDVFNVNVPVKSSEQVIEAFSIRFEDLDLILLIGQYAQNHYLENRLKTLTETVRNWKAYKPLYFPLPHPSPRNNIWMKKNSWFQEEVLPALKYRVEKTLFE